MGRFEYYKSACFLCVFWENLEKATREVFFFVAFGSFFFFAFASEISFFNIDCFFLFFFGYFEITVSSNFCLKYGWLKYCPNFCFKYIVVFFPSIFCKIFPNLNTVVFPPQFLKILSKYVDRRLKFRSFRSTAICTIGTLPVHFLYRNPVQLFLPEQILVCLLFRMELKLVCLFLPGR